MTAPEDELPDGVEALLSNWQVAERTDEDWEQTASAIEARIALVKPGRGAAEDLLAAPQPQSPSDGVLPAATDTESAIDDLWDDADDAAPTPSLEAVAQDGAQAEPDDEPVPAAPPHSTPASSSKEPPKERISLAALARAHLESAEADDSQEIAKESLSLAKRARTSAPSVPDSVRDNAAQLAAEFGQTSPPAPAPVSPSAAAPATNMAPLPQPMVTAEPVAGSRFGAGPAIMVGLSVLGIAAAAFILIRSMKQNTPVALAPTTMTAAPPPAAAKPTASSVLADPEVVAIEELPPSAEPPAPGTPPAATAPAKVAAGGTPAAEAKPEQKTKPEKTDEDPRMRPAAQPTDVPAKPSLGAVQAAIGSVMGSARACVAGQDSPSSAAVTFGSNGRVQSVSVSGPAAGTPAQACIVAALSKARVPPFARPTFSVRTTVRP